MSSKPKASKPRIVKLQFKAPRKGKGGLAEMKVNLPKLFGVDAISPADAEAIGFEILDIIIDRSRVDNDDANGKGFKSYSKAYKESLAFAAAGKSGSTANLTQTGSMLNSMHIKNVSSEGEVTIGWDGDFNNAKAYAHNVGDGNAPQRWFLSLKSGELTDIKAGNAGIIEEREKIDISDDPPPTKRISFGDLIKLFGVSSNDG